MSNQGKEPTLEAQQAYIKNFVADTLLGITPHEYTPLETNEDRIAYLQSLYKLTEIYYWNCQRMRTPVYFHAMHEWSGVISTFLSIHIDLLKQGHNTIDGCGNKELGKHIPEHRLEYLAKKINCIFGGMLEVKVISHEPSK